MLSLGRLARCATAELGQSSTSPQCHSSRSPPTPPPRCARRRPSPPTGGRVEPAVPSFRTRTAICDCPARWGRVGEGGRCCCTMSGFHHPPPPPPPPPPLH